MVWFQVFVRRLMHVMRLLGHKNIAKTLIYTRLVEFEGDEYNSAVANSVEEARASDDFNNY